MKNKIILFLLAESIGLNVYFYVQLQKTELQKSTTFVDVQEKEMAAEVKKIVEKQSEEKRNIDTVSVKKAALKRVEPKGKIEEKNIAEVDKDKKEELGPPFDPAEKERVWKEESQKFFGDQLRLSQSEIDSYRALREQRELELAAYFDKRMAEQNSSKDENAVYMFTLEDTIFVGNLNKKYLDQLRDQLGEDNLSVYNNFKMSFNQKVAKEKKFHLVIEF